MTAAIGEGGDDLFEVAAWALETGVWDGRPVYWEDAEDFCSRAAEKIHLLVTERDVIPAGFCKSVGKFWDEHKVAILVTAGVLAVAATVAVVLVCTGGTATPVVLTGSAAALDSFSKEAPPPPKQESARPPSPIPPKTFAPSKEWVPNLNFHFESFEPAPSFPKEAFGFSRSSPLLPLGDPIRGTIHYHCGINNTQESILEAQKCMHGTLSGEFRIQPYHVHDDSMVHGLGLVGLEKLGVPREVADKLLPIMAPGLLLVEQLATGSIYRPTDLESQVKAMSANAEKILEMGNPKLKQVHVTFSHGGSEIKQVLQKLPQEQRDTVIVIAVGTTTILENNANLAHKIYNVIGSKDWPSQVCNGGILGLQSKAERANIEIVPQEETQTGIGGHFFMQEDYQKRIGEIVKEEILEKYEIY